jgi:molybdate transport system ATP-binding protein
VGPNGSGKTSLLKLILGVLRPERGRVVLDGEPLFDSESGLDLPIEGRRLGYVPQGFGLFPHLTVVENVEFGLNGDPALASAPARRERALSLLAELEVGALAGRRPSVLSGGERQRVALARALGRRPRALLLDEPLAALDAGGRKRVRSFLAASLERLGLPAVIVTHDPRDAEALAGTIAVIEAGQLVQLGTLEELRAKPWSPFVEEFQASGADSRLRSR